MAKPKNSQTSPNGVSYTILNRALNAVSKRLKFPLMATAAAGAIGLLSSCGSGFDYEPSTATLTIIPGQIQFGELRPSISAEELEAQAKAEEAKGDA